MEQGLAMLNKKALAASVSASPAVYVDDVASVYLYTGNGSTQTITNNIDLSEDGGLVWIKSRSAATDHQLFDTARGATNELISNSTAAQAADADTLTAFNADGFSLGADSNVNTSAAIYCSWSFRKQPKFFDIVSYTGNGTSGRTVAHNLGSTPGMIIVKRTGSPGGEWIVYHRSNTAAPATDYLRLNSLNGTSDNNTYWNDTDPTSSVFTLGSDVDVNASGGAYVAYLFAHDAGGFGVSGADNIISCGGFTTTAGGTADVNLGYEPQFVLFKPANTTGNWVLSDNMRSMTTNYGTKSLFPNTDGVEAGGSGNVFPNSTGFTNTGLAGTAQYVYVAIRRSMKPPTSGTDVFQPIAYTGDNSDNRLVNTGIITDTAMARIRNTTSTPGFVFGSRLRGDSFLYSLSTSAEFTDDDSLMTPTIGYGESFSAINGFGVGNDATRRLNNSSTPQLAYAFKRAAGFHDVVCYTGTGSATTVTHNLGFVPEMIIVKNLTTTQNWRVYHKLLTSANFYLNLNTTAAQASATSVWNGTTPTSSVFSVGDDPSVNESGSQFVAYLFASINGVSKVGSYTGTASTQTINAALPSGARFVMIKRINTTGGWVVFDTARGMVSGTNPRLFINTTTAEANANWIYTATNGFQIVTTDASVNASGSTYIYLAIA
jgi:hypothetical protein